MSQRHWIRHLDVIGDIVLSAASQQYGGFTVPSVDEILEPYAKRPMKII